MQEGAGGAQAPFVCLMHRGTGKHLPVFCAEARWLRTALQVGRPCDASASASCDSKSISVVIRIIEGLSCSSGETLSCSSGELTESLM